MRGSIAVVLLAVSVLALGLVTAPPADAASRIQIVRVNYDPPGPDRGHNAALNAEWVKFRNVSRVPVRMTGFTLRDRANHRYRFGPTTVMPG
ncbi:hypothetical protein BJF85_23660 [Saccharomonospora sp. CUA-673]|uniref:lamin tail domain-containing protein n=1 Tax=Saccharomonospora sp. CUA-673 TaxID=1904969 RepID=UPI0009621D62|nr:lamin tail domain-containing protein [Saccharomonospora sp. CUA-673]OLT41565.1 hypothetical protein BJF85_23660 [Saccharomonospora sp. CUA-673]